MNPTVKAKWLNALRSGEYAQGTERLCHEEYFCCLGVLTDLYLKEHEQEWESRPDEEYGVVRGVNGQFLNLPEEVAEWAGIETDGWLPEPVATSNKCVACPEGHTSWARNLIALNDNANYTFPEIADVIEKQF